MVATSEPSAPTARPVNRDNAKKITVLISCLVQQVIMRVWISTRFGVISEQVPTANESPTFIKGNFTVPAPGCKDFFSRLRAAFALAAPGLLPRNRRSDQKLVPKSGLLPLLKRGRFYGLTPPISPADAAHQPCVEGVGRAGCSSEHQLSGPCPPGAPPGSANSGRSGNTSFRSSFLKQAF